MGLGRQTIARPGGMPQTEGCSIPGRRLAGIITRIATTKIRPKENADSAVVRFLEKNIYGILNAFPHAAKIRRSIIARVRGSHPRESQVSANI